VAMVVAMVVVAMVVAMVEAMAGRKNEPRNHCNLSHSHMRRQTR
jgi:hypothetical protein